MVRFLPLALFARAIFAEELEPVEPQLPAINVAVEQSVKEKLVSDPLISSSETSASVEKISEESLISSFFNRNTTSEEAPSTAQDGASYTINYNTVPIIEYIRFASKICNVNFIFNEEDLNFTVTVVSEGPITADNVMATLVQILRIHNLQLIEQGNNLVIHTSNDVQQLATLFSDKHPPTRATPPIVTRIFRLHYVKTESMAAIIRPMISKTAILETSAETRQIILTDVTANVEKVALLIENLDASNTLFEIKSFEAIHNKPEYLISITTQLMGPLTQGNPFILVPANLSNVIFIASTPELTTRALQILKGLDIPPKKSVLSERKLKSENIFVYKLQNRSGDVILSGLSHIADNLEHSGVPEADLLETIDTAKWIRETNAIMIVGSADSVAKVKEFIASLDVPTEDSLQKANFFVYKPANKPATDVYSAIREMAQNLKGAPGSDPMLIKTMESAKVNSATETITFSGEERTFPRVKELLATIDSSKSRTSDYGKSASTKFLIYKPKFQKGDQIASSLKEVTEDLQSNGLADPNMLGALRSMKWVKSTNSLLFTGDAESIQKIEGLLATLDVPSDHPSISQKSNFFLYQIKASTPQQIDSTLRSFAKNLDKTNPENDNLAKTIEGMKYTKETNSILFTGSDVTLKRLQEILPMFDLPTPSLPKTNFYLYQIKASPPAQILTSLKTFAHNLDKSDPNNEGLSKTIEEMQYNKDTNSILFTGPDPALKRLQEILPTFDVGSSSNAKFFIYKPKFQKGAQLAASIRDIAETLKSNELADPNMIRTLQSMKWVQSTNSLLFTGDPDSLQKVENLIATLDVQGSQGGGYFIYKLQNVSGQTIEKDLEELEKELKIGGENTKILDAIDNLRYIKETNSFLITGDQDTINEMKDILARYDAVGASTKTDHLMYKPVNTTPEAIEAAIRDIAAKFRASGLTDPSLLATLDSMQYSSSSQTLLFTGTPQALSKLAVILKEIDVPSTKHATIQKIGKSTYLVYKLKNASPSNMTASVKAIAQDLKKSGNGDKEFVAALNSMKYVKESNSLLFTGTSDALAKVEALLEKFDVQGAVHPDVAKTLVPGATNFYVYKPQSLSGPELEKIMQDFADQLRQTGLSDPELINTIASMRWVEKTSSLLFTGTPKSIEQVKELLKEFDIPANLPGGSVPTTGEATIQSVDNTGFLVYKLQFHRGEEIQNALRQIAKDLTLSNAQVNQALLNSINSVQWLEVTNSLLCSGDSETLTRLRELIKNLDIPLKQVFIEMLVIQTSLSNALTFGLEWGSRFKYKDKFSGTMNNLAVTDVLNSPLLGINATNTPTPAIVPVLGPGFDLGIIGEVIRHGGETFLTLGSLLAALQVDTESTIVMTPKILTQDGRTSTIFQGQNIPFAGSFISNSSPSGTGGTIGTTNIEYRDIGMSLTVTPVLGNSDIVTLDINLDQTSTGNLNAAQNQITFTSTGVPFAINGITTSKTTMQTTVHVPDNHFLILSGMVNNSSTKVKSGIPCLGGLPFVGALFSRDDTTIVDTNVVIFMRPHIINSLDDITRITKDQEIFFREQSGTPFIEHGFNEAMELIKTVDDE